MNARPPRHLAMTVAIAVFTALLAFASAGESSQAAAAASFVPLKPARLLDTRVAGHAASGVRPAGSVFAVDVAGRGGVAPDAVAAMLNATVDAPAAGGHLTVWPCGDPQPVTSSLNFAAGETRANLAVAKIGAKGRVCVFVSQATDVIVDVSGYFAAGAGFEPLAPLRLHDSRPGAVTSDGKESGQGASSSFRVQIVGRGVPTGAHAAALNVTVTQPSQAGFVTVWPCDSPRPTASNVNFAVGQTVANAVVSRLDGEGGVCVHSNVITHVVVDVAGWFADGSVAAITPHRLTDTRRASSEVTGRRSAGVPVRVQVAGRGPVPVDAVAVIATVTAVDPAANGFISIYACGERPNASSLNYRSVTTTANLVFATLDAAGGLCVFSQEATDVVIDVTGFFGGGAKRPAITNPLVTTSVPVTTTTTKPPVTTTTPTATTTPASTTTTTTITTTTTTATTATTTTAPATTTTTTTVPGTTTTVPSQGYTGPYIDRARIPAPRAGISATEYAATASNPWVDPTNIGAFRTECKFSHMAFDDPIVFPGQPGRSHLHTFSGNTTTNGTTTDLSTGSSTCTGGTANRSSYWVPSMIDTTTGVPVVPTFNQLYYKTGYYGVVPESVISPPAGLKIVAGSAMNSAPGSTTRVQFYCNSNGRASSSIPQCAQGDTLVQAIMFPQCWDGINLDSPDHKMHMAYPAGQGCPASHPVAIPEVVQHWWYTVGAAGTDEWRLSSDMYDPALPAGYSNHADVWFSWDRTTVERIRTTCWNARMDCSMNLIGDNTRLRWRD